MRRKGLLGFLVLATLVAYGLSAEEAPGYTIQPVLEPGCVRFARKGSPVVTNGWMNGVYVSSAGVLVGGGRSSDNPDLSSYSHVTLVSSEVGYSWNRSTPEYYLSDVVKAPENVDWKATREHYDADYAAAAALGKTLPFLLNPDDYNHCVYAMSGGTQEFVWYLKDGSAVTNSYIVASTCSGRPRRLFWTDAPYNAPPISMQGKFIRIFDNGSVTKIEKGAVTNIVGGIEMVQTNAIVSGVYVDETAQVMYATGKPKGQFVLVYYDSGEYNNILCVEVIEVSEPITTTAFGTIGRKLEPTGLGYDISGLEPQVQSGIGDSDDSRGDYLYQHAGEQSYSPKNGYIYPLRPSVGKRWKAEVYWLETDPMGVQWPFEFDQYENDWPEKGCVYVRGDLDGDVGAKIFIPDDYTATLGSYQYPEGHALAVEGDGSFTTRGEGWSLLKLDGDDDVWFMPIHSVSRSNAKYFTLQSSDVLIGQELKVRGGVNSGVAGGLREVITASGEAPGYIYQPASGPQYNANLYYEMTNATADADMDYSAGLPPAVFAVNTDEFMPTLEVWWSRRVTELDGEELPVWIDVPTLPQVYRPVWPEATEAPTIVIASQQGSAGESLFQQYGAATFDKMNSQVQLSARRYFPNGTGTVSFWTRPQASADPINGQTNSASSLLVLGTLSTDTVDSGSISLVIGKHEVLELYQNTELLATVPMPKLSRPNIWTHLALTFENAERYSLYTNAALAVSGTLKDASFLGAVLDRCYAGKMTSSEVIAEKLVERLKEAAEKSAEAEPQESTEDFVDCGTAAEVRDAILAGQNIRLSDSVTLAPGSGGQEPGGNVILDLNGCTLSLRSDVRLFKSYGNYTFEIRDSNSNGVGRITRAGGSGVYPYPGSLAKIGGNARLILTSGSIEGLDSGCADEDVGAVVQIVGDARFVMNGGRISDCSTPYNGGAVSVQTNGVFEMNRGVITGCKAGKDGGAVCTRDSGRFVMNGGIIRACQAQRGGAFYLANGGELRQGLIAKNLAVCSDYSSVAAGGAVYVENGAFSMLGGVILGNTTEGAETVPGAIVVDGEGASFAMDGGLIAGNTCNSAATGACTKNGAITVESGIYDTEPAKMPDAGTTASVSIEPDTYFEPTLEMTFVGDYGLPLGVSVGRQIAEITMRSVAMTAASVQEARYRILAGDATAVTGYYSFRSGEDLGSAYQAAAGVDSRYFLDRVSGGYCRAKNVSLGIPGAPCYKSYVIDSDSTPSVYYNNLKGFVGYNPNDEHAFMKAGAGGYVAWALRADLNIDGHPAVLVEYEKDGKAKMQFFHVVVTNEQWSTLADTCVAGLALPGPKPITIMDDPWLPADYWDRDPYVAGNLPGPAYRDRKGQLWARCAGTLPVYMYYRMQEGFWFPQYGIDGQPAVGEQIPWLSVFNDPSTANDPMNGAPQPAMWTWTIRWPETANEMKIGQTLYTATDGLPGIYNMKSVSVVYPTPQEESGVTNTVMLTDPTQIQSVDFDFDLLTKLGLTADKNGGLTVRKGKYYFNELPPHLSTRIWVDPTAGTLGKGRLCLTGKYDQKNAGVSVLYVNVLTSSEREQLRTVVPESKRSGNAWDTWRLAVNKLGLEPVNPSETYRQGAEVKTTYLARDSYALAAMGSTNWVVLIENDAPTTNYIAAASSVTNTVNMGVNDGDPVNMHIFKVIPEYYTGRIVAKEDEQNLLSQRLTVMYTESFAGAPENYEFEWRSADPCADGSVPYHYGDEQEYVLRAGFADAKTPRITIGEQGDTLANMVNKYWICRYRAKDENCPAWAVMGDRWSDWCEPPALAEGWVQRVLNNVTPFNQLMTDLYENEAETTVSMIAKAGKPYTGDVAFNQDALTECGLIELYETLLNKAESMSLLLEYRDSGVNKQLMQAVERLGDLYTVLGDEAYSDAKNPTIGFGSEVVLDNGAGLSLDYGAVSSSLFCFDNQVRTLLDEELALLRGRAGDSAPFTRKNAGTADEYKVMPTGPYYNRLLWNFTKGVTAGEVAYAVNYNIEGTETVALSEEQAAAIYPQGHGDAYGHYLSALKGWYRLLRNPYFNWERSQTEMNVADIAVNVDYYEEAKFAEAALKVAKTAADVVDLTARKAYDDEGAKLAGYRDEESTRSFGYGEWANRGAYGALVNWAVANSLLPEDASDPDSAETDADYAASGLKRIDRGTVDELVELGHQADAIQSAEDRIDTGLNPLGLDENAIPFDITPIGANDGTKTHYEQIRERAGTAVENARKLLDRAQEQSNRLRMIQEAGDEYEDMISEEELALTQELIGYYGKPYSDDIGPGKTYEQGYEGPDTVHYMWMDLLKFGVTGYGEKVVTVTNYVNYINMTDFTKLLDVFSSSDAADKKVAVSLNVSLSSPAVVIKPTTITGERPMQGTIQEKYVTFLQKYKALSAAEVAYRSQYDMLEADISSMVGLLAWTESLQAVRQLFDIVKIATAQSNYKTTMALNNLDVSSKIMFAQLEIAKEGVSVSTGAGTTVVSCPKSLVSKATGKAELKAGTTAKNLWLKLKEKQASTERLGTIIAGALDAVAAGLSEWQLEYTYAKQLKASISGVNAAAVNVQTAYYDMNAAIEAYKSEVAKAELILEKREALRKRWVNKISQLRYNDMFFRLLRNQALSRYSASFDLAQKYVWETAKVYGYETALAADEDASYANFLNQIVTSRSLGSFAADGTPIVGDVGDTGLAGILAQMDENWLVLKPRLGINNPQPYATWFSLRGECFRILPGEDGDSAWAKELTKHWVDDIQSNEDFIRYCQPFQSQFGLKEKEPGLVIPFETTIDFAKNFFGQDLAGGDNAYDSTWYSTRIYAAGVWFDGYNAKTADATASAKPALANTPSAYLVPVGLDCMRVPGLDDGDIVAYNVVDQVIAAPYAIGSQHLNDLSWYPSASQGDLGGADSTTKIRRHPSFRAYFDENGGEPTDDKLDCTRLVGRSAWNTKWILVIPAGSMNADRDKALSVFINGSDVNRDGKLDLKPVSDIRIGFKTYSNSGN